jgi:hypothetical protein
MASTPAAEIAGAPGLETVSAAREQLVGHAMRDDLRVVVLLTGTITGLLAVVTFIGADARWLAALGGEIAIRHSIPAGLPFAPAASHWPNTLVLAELSFHALVSALGDRGLMLAQLTAAAVGTIVLMRDAIAGGATRQAATGAVMLGSFGALADLATVRVQLYSIALLPVCAATLRHDARNPTWRIWLVVPLLALWSNLHGGALLGLGVTLAYLLLARARRDPLTATAVSVAATAGMCATPAGLRTVSYYHGVLTNVAAQRGEGLWSPLSLASPFDLLLIVVGIVLVFQAVRSRPRAWEIVVMAALILATVKAGRSGIWLVLFTVPVAARSFRPRVIWDRALPALATAGIVALVLGVARGPINPGASESLISRAIALSHGSPVLAEDVLAEQVALAGGKIWAGNPIDAFPRRTQAEYLDWASGQPAGIVALGPEVRVVLVGRGGPAERLTLRDPSFRMIASDRGTALYIRRKAS